MKLDELLLAVAGLLGSWGECEIFEGNRFVNPPAPSGDVNAPSALVQWELGEDEWDREQSTFGTNAYTGAVSLVVAVDEGGGEHRIDVLSEQLEDLFEAAEISGVEFLPGERTTLADIASEASAHAVRELRIPYVRFKEKAA